MISYIIRSALYLILLLFIAIFGIARFKKLAIPFKLVTGIVGVTFILESLSHVFAYLYQDSRPVAHITSIAELNFYFSIFYFLFRQKTIKKVVVGLIIFFNIFSVINSFYLQPYYNNFPSNVLLPVQICYALLSLLMFNQMLSNTIMTKITSQSIFWYASAMLFISTSLFLYLGLGNYFAKHHIYAANLNFFGTIINIIFYPMLGYAIYLNSKENIFNEG